MEADVGEKFPCPVIAERRVGQGVAGLGAGAGLDVVRIDGDRARGDPWGAGDHPLPAVLDRLDPTVVESEMGLVVHALEALHDGLLHLVDDLSALAALGIYSMDAFVMDLDLEILRPTPVATKPAPYLS